MTRYTGIITRYRDWLPIADDSRIITLGEGNTPLIRLDRLTRTTGRDATLYVKFEGLNPTGSFKDRGMCFAVTKAVEAGSRALICASTGNTSASAAAYAARAGLAAFVLIPEGKIALGKLSQAMIHGAIVVQIQGNFDAGMRLVKEIAATTPITLVNSVNPYRLQGQKTAAFEIVDALGFAPQYHYLPVGNAGNITAHWLGYRDYQGQGRCSMPKLVGYQAAGAAPFVSGKMVDDPETIATAIRIGHPQSWALAQSARAATNGWFGAIDDDEILATQRLMAREEGIFCEPASAVSVAGALRDLRAGRIEEGTTIVCTVTGHGLKDPDVAIRQGGPADLMTVAPTLAAVRAIILERTA
ncbi:MAG TPA: threonine synthase [Acidiferrobacter sp.]|nr:threonine synthase [Acidiferrobacter sp.]